MMFPTMSDRSGNGLDGLYAASPAVCPLTPGFFPGAKRANWFDNDAVPHHYSYGQAPSGGVDFTQPFSFDCWVLGDPSADVAGLFGTGDTALGIGADFGAASDGSIVFRIQNATDYFENHTVPGVFPFDANHHHLGMAFNGLTTALYLDGSALTTTYIHNSFVPTGAFTDPTVGRSFGALPPVLGGEFGQPAFYQSVLSAGTFATHHAATASLAAYSAAVLANSPTQYYDLDDQCPGGWFVTTIGMGT